MNRQKTRKCRKCGKKFTAILNVWYCSGQCERLTANPVAKFAARLHKSVVHTSKKTYSRKEKHRNVELY